MSLFATATRTEPDEKDDTVHATGWKALVAKWLGIPSVSTTPWNDNAKLWGGHLAPPPASQTRWYLAGIEAAVHAADQGDIEQFAKLARTMGRDGSLAGVLRTRTSGLVRLPKRFTGRPDMVAALEGTKKRRGIFEQMFPAPELAALLADGIKLNVAVGELLPVKGRNFPVFRRLNPQYLLYRWQENRWHYRSMEGLLPITPGDGRWILHLPNGENEPWANALGWALGRAWMTKDHAFYLRANYESKLANPARVAYAPNGATEAQRTNFFQKIIAWGVNTVFSLLPGWEIKLLESNGRGYEVFMQTIKKCDEEIIIALGSSPVLIDGGTGFVNADVHKSIRADVIQDDAEGLAHTLNTQGIPPWVNALYGADALEEAPTVAWDVTPPKDLKAEAESLSAAAKAIVDLRDALAPSGKKPDEDAIAVRFAIPIALGGPEIEVKEIDTDELVKLIELGKQVGIKPTADSIATILQNAGIETEAAPATAASKLILAPTDAAKVVRGKEARHSLGLEPFGDSRDDMTLPEMDNGQTEKVAA